MKQVPAGFFEHLCLITEGFIETMEIMDEKCKKRKNVEFVEITSYQSG